MENEVTKTKEKLEKYLSESYRIIKENEKILKGIKIMEKEDKNMIKLLTYITKINKHKKENKSLLRELMKNLKLSFDEEIIVLNMMNIILMEFKFQKILNLKIYL